MRSVFVAAVFVLAVTASVGEQPFGYAQDKRCCSQAAGLGKPLIPAGPSRDLRPALERGATEGCPSGAPREPAEGLPYATAAGRTGLVEIYRVRIVNDAGGEIAGSRDGGRTWTRLGQVVRWTEKVNPRGFAASTFAPIGTVCATAVNAIHIKTDHNPDTDRAAVFSLVPRDLADVSEAEYESFLSPDSSIYTDIPGGEGIFGGGWAPLVGDPVELETAGGLAPLARGYLPKRGDVIVMRVLRPERYPAQMLFENRFQGLIKLEYPDGSVEVIGAVLRPVVGVGRFPGSLEAGIGRIRANHPGVIDISVSPPGRIGAFQIIPAAHAMDPGTTYMRVKTQWMVVGPVCATDPSWEGVAPLFLRYLQPAYRAQDIRDGDWEAKLLSHFLVEARVKGEWGPMPVLDLGADAEAPLPEWAATALLEVEAIRIWFPLASGEAKV